MKKRILSLALALCMVLSLLPGLSAAAAGAMLDAYNVSDPAAGASGYYISALDDETNTRIPFDFTIPEDGATVLIFFRGATGSNTCLNSSALLRSIAGSSWVSNEKVHIVAIESADTDREQVQDFVQQYAGDAAQYMDIYRDVGSNKVLWRYVMQVLQTGSVTYPLVCVVTEEAGEKTVRYAKTAVTTEMVIRNTLATLVDGIEAEPIMTVSVPGTRNYDEANEVFRLMNEQRTANGAAALTLNATLTEIAMQRAAEIALYYSHNRPDGSDCFTAAEGVYTGYTALGENIAALQTSAAQVMTSWMNSTGHRANILNARYTQVGVGCFENNGYLYWVQFFGNSTTDASVSTQTGTQIVSTPVDTITSNLSLQIVGGGAVKLEAGASKTLQLVNWNLTLGVSYIYTILRPFADDVTSDGSTIAAVEIGSNGTLNITGVNAGTGTLLIRAYEGEPDPFTINVTVTPGDHTHTYTDTRVSPTCTEQGYTLHTCTRCGIHYSDNVVPAAHTMGAWTVTKEPTCTEYGSRSRTCAVCAETETERIAPLGHAYTAKVTEPTCTEQGYTTYTCTRCGDVYEGYYVDALGHSWSAWVNTLEPTETENGLQLRRCTRCGETEAQVIPALNHTHSYTAEVTKPTCTEQGYTTHTCTCGDSYVDSYVDALGHKTELKNAKAATCTEAGYTGDVVCTRCNVTVTKGKVIAALGHKWDDGKVTTEPAATTDGVKTYTCTVCGETRTEAIPATGEQPIDPVKPIDPTTVFTDVSHDWAYPGIEYCYNHGLMAGMTNTTFEPNSALTRGQFVAILWRQLDCPAPKGENPFTDLTQDYYKDAITWAAENKVVYGTSATTFEPDCAITRQDLTTMFYRYVGEYLKQDVSGAADIRTFPDYSSVADYAQAAMAWAKGVGLITGNKIGGTIYLDPLGAATRAQAATMFMNLCEKVLK